MESTGNQGAAAHPVLTVIVPTYNEAPNILEVAARIDGALHATPYELIFVDDSSDLTPDVIADLSLRDARVRLEHRINARGLGTAVVRGIELSNADVMAVIDADLQHPPELLPEMLACIDEADIVIPTRFMRGGDDGGLDLGRKLVSGVARYLGKFVLRRLRGVSDPTSGYFMFRRSVVAGSELNPIGWKILLEVLVRGHYRRIVEIPYSFAPRHAGESKLRITEHFRYLAHLLKLAATSPADRRFYASALVGFTGMFVNLAVFALSIKVATPPLAGGTSAIVAMVWNLVLNDQLTWRHLPHDSQLATAGRYVATAFTGVAIAISVLTLLNLDFRVQPLIAELVAIAASAGWNFTIHNLWTWRTEDLEAAAGFSIRHMVAASRAPATSTQ